ncbi:MAG: hypothetical protein LBG27_02020 [Spirochaetaceae bacterium]|jgi:hypothetical protein|nr:hypothetical protein [Spirochaetaceae bacterium]
MHKPRKLQQNVWYRVGTEVNIGDPLFRLPWTKVLLHRVLREAKKRFSFEMRGLKVEGARLTFYIKPNDGLQLPNIMQFLKQTFSIRFNVLTGRSGHVWKNRYESEILEGEPPAWAKEADWAAVETAAKKPLPTVGVYKLAWVSPRSPWVTITIVISVKNVPKPASPPA